MREIIDVAVKALQKYFTTLSYLGYIKDEDVKKILVLLLLEELLNQWYPFVTENDCYGKQYLRSTKQIPYLIKIGNPKIYPIDYYSGEITLVSRERMRYVGYNNYLQNIIYASIGPDNYLYLKSNNPQYLYLNKVKLTGIFDNAEVASDLQCEETDSSCDILDRDFPLESSLVPQVIELVVKALSGSIYKPKDPNNDAADNLSEIASFLRNNMKSNFQKQFEG